jgi:phosphate starvation-inducible protein PhoH and related proteins
VRKFHQYKTAIGSCVFFNSQLYMSKRKNLKNGLDELELEFVEENMKRESSAMDYLSSPSLKTQLKTLSYKVTPKCKNEKQKEFLKQLKDKKKEICFGIGSPGTGKSFISLSYALQAVKNGDYDKIIMVVPTAQCGGGDLNVGLLKGELYDKVAPFCEADKYTIEKILSISGTIAAKEYANALVNSGIIQYEFVTFMLGKTFDNALILINECEQYSKDNMRLILTRLGDNSKIIITGDAKQVNRRSIKNKTDICGLIYSVDKLKDMDEVSITEFTDEDIVRNKLITKILQRFDE